MEPNRWIGVVSTVDEHDAHSRTKVKSKHITEYRINYTVSLVKALHNASFAYAISL